MITIWMLGATLLTLLAGSAAWCIERALRLRGRQGRWPWIAALGISVVWPLLAPFVMIPVADRVQQSVAARGVGPVVQALSSTAEGPSFAWRTWLAHFDRPLVALWVLLSVTLIWRFVRELRALRRLSEQSGSITAPSSRTARAAALERGTAAEGIEVLVSASVGPAVFGALRPRIVIPEWLLELDASLRELVLAHEVQHVRSGDARTLAVTHALVALLPWNAGLWWIERRLRIATELDCDARVLADGADPRRYGQLLMLIAQRQGHATFSPMMAGHPSTLHARILAMHAPAPARPALRAALLVGLALVAGGAAASPALARELAAVRPPARAQGTPQDTGKKPMKDFSVVNQAAFAPGSANPRYPQALKDAGKTGVVVAQMVVDTNGTADVRTLKIIRSADPAFVEAIKTAMPGFKFVPARVDNNRKVKQLVQIQYRFAIQGKPAPTDTVVPSPKLLQLEVVITGSTK